MNSRCQTLPLAALLFVSVLSVSNAQRPTVPNAGSGKQTRFVAPPGEETAAAKQSIDQMWKSIKGAKDWKLETVEVGGTKDAIYEIGKSSLTTVVDGKDNTYTCDYVVIWKRQKDGTYRAQTDIYN